MTRGAIYPDLEGKVVIVTGGASGIGEAIVRGFGRQKAKVGFIDVQGERGRALRDELTRSGGLIHFECTDITDIAALRGAIAAIRTALGPVAILVNNAAHDERHATDAVTPEYFDERIAVNLKHQLFAAQAVLPDMVAAKAGAICNMGSVSWMVGSGGMVVYTAAKSAVLGLTRSLARDYGPHNIRVNAIAPGWVRTERQVRLWITPQDEQEQLGKQCLQRWLVPDDIARVVVFLSSDEAAACTNQHYVVDGGWI